MAKVIHVKHARQRYAMVPVLDADGKPTYRTQTLAKPTKRLGRTETQVRVTEQDRTKPLPLETCGYCKEPIEVGTAYKHTTVKKSYGGVRYVRHETCPSWQPWDLSDSLSANIARIVHDAETAMQDAEDADTVTSAMTEAAEQIRELADQKRESAQSIEDGFGHETYVSQELSEMADSLESWAEEVEGYSPEDAPDDEDEHVVTENENGTADCSCGESFTDADGAEEHATAANEGHDEEVSDWRETVTSEASDILGESPA